MRTLKISEAAALLDVSPQTLRGWERRFGYPAPQRTPGGHRLYMHGDVAALRAALLQGLSLSAAINHAREAASTDAATLVAALAAYDLERADGAMELALGMRPVQGAVEEVLLPSLEEIARRCGGDSAQWALAARWADGWLRRAHRLAPPAAHRLAILVGDATRGNLDADALATRAFELFCARSGARIVVLPISGLSRLADVVASLPPDAAVIAGAHATDDAVALWAQRVRAVAGPLPVALFRRSSATTPATRSIDSVADSPYGAHLHLLALIKQDQAGTADRNELTVLAGDHRTPDAPARAASSNRSSR
jgi:DNA-binding transcriptional MerR regulator